MRIRILGIRGIPAAHGGFETFAERLALHLQSKGWKVTVYCQLDSVTPNFIDDWKGIERVHLCPGPTSGALSTIVFDLKSVLHARKYNDLCLTLGYNTAVFSWFLWAARIVNVINMDGIEWARAKWGPIAKGWFWLNERIACRFGNHLIADNPHILEHLASRVKRSNISMIPYGADNVIEASAELLAKFNLTPDHFLTVIARPEPENSVLEVVSAFSARPRGYTLVVLGNYTDNNPYHRAVKRAAGKEVLFAGAVYDGKLLSALRFFSRAYIHGHQVGGTNPSLVEAMGAGNAVFAHDNRFNRWVAGQSSMYFQDAGSLDKLLSSALSDTSALMRMREGSRQRFQEVFQWGKILEEYTDLLRQVGR